MNAVKNKSKVKKIDIGTHNSKTIFSLLYSYNMSITLIADSFVFIFRIEIVDSPFDINCWLILSS